MISVISNLLVPGLFRKNVPYFKVYHLAITTIEIIKE